VVERVVPDDPRPQLLPGGRASPGRGCRELADSRGERGGIAGRGKQIER
jgi:hypothetical protein